MIPRHLVDISSIVKLTKNTEKLKIKCSCDENYFSVCVYSEACNDNIRKKFNEIINENGKLYFVKRSFFGKIIKKIEFNKDIKKQRRIVIAKCEKCGKEYVIFDNYNHGYDATILFEKNYSLNDIDLKEYDKKIYKSLRIYIDIYQDMSYDEFKLEFKDVDYDQYLNSFTNIDIYGINSKKRKIKIFSEETA